MNNYINALYLTSFQKKRKKEKINALYSFNNILSCTTFVAHYLRINNNMAIYKTASTLYNNKKLKHCYIIIITMVVI